MDEQEKNKFYDRLQAREPELIKFHFARSGYDFLIVNGEALDSGAKIGKIHSDLESQLIPEIFQEMPTAERLADAREAITKKLGMLRSEFKVHLQPRRENIWPVVRRLIETLKAEDNADLREIVGAFKVKIRPQRPDRKENFPQIVIYPKADATELPDGTTAGRRNAERLVAALTEAMRDLEPLAEAGSVPRYNERLTDLIHIAQSGGDFKNALGEAGLLDEFFDPANNHAYLKGERPITLPEAARSTRELPRATAEHQMMATLSAELETARERGEHPIANLERDFSTLKERRREILTEVSQLEDAVREMTFVGTLEERETKVGARLAAEREPLKRELRQVEDRQRAIEAAIAGLRRGEAGRAAEYFDFDGQNLALRDQLHEVTEPATASEIAERLRSLKRQKDNLEKYAVLSRLANKQA